VNVLTDLFTEVDTCRTATVGVEENGK
jgi:hypothetical protein